MLSKKDLDVIFKYVTQKLFGDKLSDFPEANVLTGREILPIIQDGKNRNMKSENVLDLPQMVAKFTQYDTLVASSREDFIRGLSALNLKLDSKAAELKRLIETLEVTGLSISQFFGDSQTLGISQNTLSKNFNLLAQEILNVTGKTLGIVLDIIPPYVITATSDTITITVTSQFGYMDTVEIYADGVLIGSGANTLEFSVTHTIAQDTIIKAKAMILGNDYIEEKQVKKLFPYFIGAGNVYNDVMKPAYAIPYDGKLTGSFNVSVNQGDHLFIIIPSYLRDSMVRTNILGEVVASADMNGFEIPFDESTVGDLTVFTSKNTYNHGIYNIDITNNVHEQY